MKDNYYLDIILKGYEESLRAIQLEETFATFESRSTVLNMGSTKYSDAEFYQIWINSDPIKKLIERIGKDEFISYEAKSRVEVEAWGKLANFFERQQKITEREYFITNTEFFKNCLNTVDMLILNLKKIDGNTESIFYYEGVQGSLTDSVGKGFPYCNEINSFVFIRWHIKNTLKNAYKIEQDLLTPQKPQQPETTPLTLSDTTKNKHGIMENFEIKQDVSQGGIRDAIRIHIQIQYEISLKEFLRTNHLADEFFYINYIDNNQKERLQELEKEVSFFDISEGEKVTDDIADQWYNESITRDHYWYYKEYQMFLKERLTELEKIKTIEKSKKSNFDITKEVDDFEVFSNNFETEITTLFNQDISKDEALNTYYKDYFPKYLTRVNDIVSHIEQMENDFKLNFPELETDLQNLNTITSKFKKSILNDLETALNMVLKIDYERLLFEYLNITNKLETDLKIEGKKISTLFEIFYDRMLHIKSNPKPQQLKLSNSTKNEQRIMIVSENTKNLFYRLITERFSKWELESIVSELEPQNKLPFLNEINYLFKQQPIIFWKNVCFCYNKTGLVYPDDLGKTYFEDGEEYHLDTFFGTMGVYLDDVFETVNTYDIHTEMFVNSFADSVKNLIKIFKNQNKFQSQQTEIDTSTVEKIQKPKPQGKTLQQFFKEGTEPEIVNTLQIKYKDLKGKKMAYLIYLLHKEFCIINYSTNSTTESRKHFVNALTNKNSTKIMAGINILFDTNEVTLKDANRSNSNDPHYLKHNDYITIQNEIQTILNPIK